MFMRCELLIKSMRILECSPIDYGMFAYVLCEQIICITLLCDVLYVSKAVTIETSDVLVDGISLVPLFVHKLVVFPPRR